MHGLRARTSSTKHLSESSPSFKPPTASTSSTDSTPAPAQAPMDWGDVGPAAIHITDPGGNAYAEWQPNFILNLLGPPQCSISILSVGSSNCSSTRTNSLCDPKTRNVYLANGASPTNAMGYGLMATGMGKWMGDESKPPVALTLRQILWIMKRIDLLWSQCQNQVERPEIAVAVVTNLIGWLGWLRSKQMFSITWDDTKLTRPSHGPQIGLPQGVGAIEIRLLPATKGNQTKVADVVISYVCASGLTPGLWMDQLRCLWPNAQATNTIIRGRDGRIWTSRYFHQKHLYVWLVHQMKDEGDSYLWAFSNKRGCRIEDKHYSFGTCCRGGCSSSTKRNNGMQQATSDEVYEHGRWRRRIAKENMLTRYNEFGINDHINIMLLCM